MKESKDFEGMGTEFDTVNVIEADWSSISGKTLSPKVMKEVVSPDAYAAYKIERHDKNAEEYNDNEKKQWLCGEGKVEW